MKITIKMFAKIRDMVGADEVPLEVPDGCTVAELLAKLEEHHPNVSGMLAKSMVAIDNEFAAGDQVLTETDEVAILPPVSGGQEVTA